MDDGITLEHSVCCRSRSALGLIASADLLSDRALLGAPVLPAAPGCAASGYRPAVTVLKPLKGLDVELYENLATLCRQTLPAPFQLIFGVADPRTIRRSAWCAGCSASSRRLDIELVVDERVYGANYKVSNLHNMYRHAKYDVIVLADSDIRVGPELPGARRRAAAGPQVGPGHLHLPRVNTGGLPTLVESLFINTDFAALVMLARKVEKSSYAFGATIAMRREVLDEIGGFLPIANLLADDYELGYRVSQRGYRLELSPEVVDTVLAGRQLAPPLRPSAALGAHVPRQPPGRLLRQHPDPRHVLGSCQSALQRLQPAELRRQRHRDRAALPRRRRAWPGRICRPTSPSPQILLVGAEGPVRSPSCGSPPSSATRWCGAATASR